MLPSGSEISALAGSFVILPSDCPLFDGRMYSGLRLIQYFSPRSSNSISTYVAISGRAYLHLNIADVLLLPLASPYNAYVIPSKIVVLPAPVSPVIR